MYQVIQGQEERLCKDERGQELEALLLCAKVKGNKYGVQRYIEWPQIIPLGTSYLFTYSRVNTSVSGKGHFLGRPRHRGDVYQFYGD